MQRICLLFPILIALAVAGCGGGGGNPAQGAQAVSKLADSAGCINCHASVLSPVTGIAIPLEWQASAHNRLNGAGCADCHEPDAGHPNLCNKCHGGGGFAVTVNPDAAGTCGKCHGPSFPADLQMTLAPQHYGYSTARLLPGTTRASYLSGQYQGRCRACHNPHDNTLTQSHRDWAGSRHGNPRGAAWSSQDFKQKADCIRCHTTTGYISFVTSGFTAPTQGFGAGDTSRELLACDGCHSSYDFKNSVRPVGAFSAPYTDGGATATFPETGTSNLCIPCHAGVQGADALNAVTDFSNAQFVDAHDLAVAGIMYMKIGFKEFTTASAPANAAAPGKPQFTYGASYTMFTGPATPTAPAGEVNSAHRRIGTPQMNFDNHTSVVRKWIPGTMDAGGPCVTCHLNAIDSNGLLSTNARTSSHTLAINTNTFRQVCINCHKNEVTSTVRAFIDDNAGDFQHALTLARQVLLTNYRIGYTQTAPFFYDLALDPSGHTPVSDWTRGTGDQIMGRRVMGACFNINLLLKEPAAFAHARTYARRLLYDTIDYLDDGIINMSVGATALATDGATYVKGSTTALSSRAFNYLCNLTQPERK